MFKYILFDCMETLIDMTEAPGLREDALWTFEGSGNEEYWKDFDAFYKDYAEAKEYLERSLPDFKEYNMDERYQYAARLKVCENIEGFENIIDGFFRSFWNRYKSKCYLKDEVKDTLVKLSKKYKLGVVSNFKVKGGVEELLKMTGIYHLFDIIIASINIGWRKPHENIYEAAITQSGVDRSEILFIGDDYKCDYIGPRKVGLRSLLLDRYDKHPEIDERIRDFYELEGFLDNLKLL